MCAGDTMHINQLSWLKKAQTFLLVLLILAGSAYTLIMYIECCTLFWFGLWLGYNIDPPVQQGPIPAPGSAAIIYWYLGNGRGWLINCKKKILLDGLMDGWMDR